MAIVRLRHTSYTTEVWGSGSIYRADWFASSHDPEEAVSIYSCSALYQPSSGGSQLSIRLKGFSDNFNADGKTITNVTVVFKGCSNSLTTGTGKHKGSVSILNDNTGTFKTLSEIPEESDVAAYMNSTTNFTRAAVPEEYWDLVLTSSNWKLCLEEAQSANGAAYCYYSAAVIEVEYEETKDFRIGANKLSEAHLGDSWISKIYKGTQLLFEKAAPLIPRAYKQLDYIQGTGQQYIDTGIKMNSSVNIEIDAEIRQFAWHRGDTGSNIAGIFGNINCGDSGGNRCGFRWYTERNFYFYYSNTGWPTTYPTDDQFYARNLYRNDHHQLYINNSFFMSGTDGDWSGATNNALIFSQGENAKAGMKLYRAKLWDNDVLVRDMYPVKRKSDNAVGLYDVVSKTFFGNAGTGVFYEPIPDEYQAVEYIASNGNGHNTGQHIDTGYIPSDGDVFRANLTVMPLSTPNAEREYLAKYGGGGTNIQIGQLSSSTWNQKNDDTQFRYTQSKPSSANGKKMYVDGQITISGTSSLSVYLFAQNESQGNTNSVWDSSIRLYACTLSVNELPIRNYVPCYRKSDGVIGLYDTINKEFKINEGTGSFTKGPDI